MRSSLLIALSLASALAFAADVFRSVAPDGTVSYGDRPIGANAQTLHIAVDAPAARQPAADPTDAPPAAASPPETANDYVDGMTNAQIANRIAENCELAQTQLAVVESTNSLSRTQADGTMRQLSDEEIAAVRERARAEVDEWCETP